MSKTVRIEPKCEVPALMGAYSHAVKVPLPGADLIFLTGQKSMDSKGTVLHPGDIEKQTEEVFEIICKILAEAGASLPDVVKAQIYVLNVKDFHTISAVRNRYFKEIRPVSVMVEVSALSKPGCLIEIAVTAVKYHS